MENVRSCSGRPTAGPATRRSGTVLTLAALLLSGCSDTLPWTGTVEDSAGVTIVRNPEVGIWPPGGECTVEEVLKIGAADGDPAQEFGVVLSQGITVDSRGRIFVLDAQAQEIRVFSPRGKHLRTLGGAGRGPGELAGARHLLMGPGDTLFVPDWRNQRMNRFAPDGSFLGSSEFRPRKEGLSVDFKANRRGLIAEQVSPMVYGRPMPDDPRDAIVRWTSDGARADTLVLIPSGQEEVMKEGFVFDTWYAPEPSWDLRDEGGILYGVNDEYRVSVVSSDGGLERIVVRAYEPRPVRERDRERVMAHLETRWRRMEASPDQIHRLLGRQHFHEQFPAFRALYEGPGGTIWVQKVKPPSELAEDEALWFTWPSDWGDREWDVFDPDGRYLGVVTLPPRFAPSVFLEDRIYGLWLDELGVSYALVLRLVGDLP